MLKKKLLTICGLALCSAVGSQAQTMFDAFDYININHIKARLMAHGDMWYDPGPQTASCEFPKGSGKHIGFAGALWMGGYDGSGALTMAAQTYRTGTDDFWPGPLDASGHITYATSRDWAKIWKVNKADIAAFLALTSHTVANTPASILTWPGTGNANAAGNAGASLVISPGRAMAPFVDLNGNGIYEPLLGEYPDIKGDQALWCVYNDALGIHNTTMTSTIGVEVHLMAFAYSNGSLLDNVVYYEYEFKNWSTKNYEGFRIAQFADLDLGYGQDDFAGFDSSHRMGIQYNGVAADGSSAGFPANSYGTHVPVAGVSIVADPKDSAGRFVPAGSFIYYQNDNTIAGNPTNGIQYRNYMNAQLRNGDQFTNDYTGPGNVSKGYGSGPAVNYVFPGDPANNAQWSECASGNLPGDRRFVISSGDFSFPAGAVRKMTIALLTTDQDQGGCPGVSFASIKTVADTAWYYYYHPLPGLGTNTVTTGGASHINVYPNPADGKIVIDGTAGLNRDAEVTVYNTLGQVMLSTNIGASGKKELDIAALVPGMYYLLYRGSAGQEAVRFEKR